MIVMMRSTLLPFRQKLSALPQLSPRAPAISQFPPLLMTVLHQLITWPLRQAPLLPHIHTHLQGQPRAMAWEQAAVQYSTRALLLLSLLRLMPVVIRSAALL